MIVFQRWLFVIELLVELWNAKLLYSLPIYWTVQIR